MLKRFADVIFYTSLITSIIIALGGIASLEWETFWACLIASMALTGFGWCIRYILTGEKGLHPKIQNAVTNLASSTFKKLEPVIAATIHQMASRDVWEENSNHPWRRYFARLLDTSINGSLVFFTLGVIGYSFFPDPTKILFNSLEEPAGHILDVILTAFFATFLTALFIGFSGSSFGKFFFGIKIKDKNGEKIGYKKAWRRELSVWVHGLALGIPIVSLFTMYSAYRRVAETGKTTWDENGEYNVHYKNNNLKQIILNGVGVLLLVVSVSALKYLDTIPAPTRPDNITDESAHLPHHDTFADELARTAEELNKTAPQKVDSITTLENISTVGRTLIYNYSISRIETSNDEIRSYLSNEVVETTCANPDQVTLIEDYGVTYKYNYQVEGREGLFSIEVNNAVCSKLKK